MKLDADALLALLPAFYRERQADVVVEVTGGGMYRLLSGLAILVVIFALGLTTSPLALWAIPVIFLTGITFAAMGLIVCALAPSYDFFMYYFTLFITPMLLVSGVFFPADQLPAIVHAVASWLPLSHAVGLARPLLLGQIPENALMHVSALLAWRMDVAPGRRCLSSSAITWASAW